MRKPAPDVREFRHALRTVGRPSGRQLKSLQRHYRATGQVLNMRRLAEVAGYANYGGVNLQYGTLAKRLAHAIDRRLPQPALGLLATFIAPREVSNQEYLIRS